MECTVRNESTLSHWYKQPCKCTTAIKPSCSWICNIDCSLSIQPDIVKGETPCQDLWRLTNHLCTSAILQPLYCSSLLSLPPPAFLPPCLREDKATASPPVNNYLFLLTDSLMISAPDKMPPVTLLLEILPFAQHSCIYSNDLVLFACAECNTVRPL